MNHRTHSLFFVILFFLSPITICNVDLTLQSFKAENGSLKKNFIILLKKLFSKKVFFETGTYSGDTTATASSVFNIVYSTELCERIYQDAIKRFHHNNKIHLYYGDSEEILKKILPTIAEEIIFWLDAHYCGVGTGKGISDPPILEELKAIQLHKKQNSIIMIDDLRGFYSVNWPSLAQAIVHLKNINPDYTIIAFGDAILAYPENIHITASDCLKACSISRFFDTHCFNYTIDDVLRAEEIIATTTGTELDALNTLFTYIRESNDQYGVLWKALISYHNEQYQQAYNLFSTLLATANQRGINHWRVHWYLAKTAFKLHDFDAAKNELEIVIHNSSDFYPAHKLLAVINDIKK